MSSSSTSAVHLAHAEQSHQRQMRQAANHRPNRRNPVARKIPRLAGHNRGHNGHQRARHFGSKAPQQQNKRQHRDRQGHRGQTCLRQSAQHFIKLHRRPARIHGDAKHLAQHGDSYLKSHAGKKAHQHRPRKKIRNKRQPQHPRQQQNAAVSTATMPASAIYFALARRRCARHAAGKNRRRRRVRRHHHVARRAEGRKRNQRQKERVKPRHHGHSRDLAVSQHLRDIHRRHHDAGERVAQSGCAFERQ